MTLWQRREIGGALAGAVVLGALGVRAKDGPVTHRVTIRRFRFEPAALVIRPGDRVRWVNKDLAPHTATAADGTWDTGGLAKGDSAEIRFDAPGRLAYICAFHPHMTAEITVGGAG